jgi:peptidyl-prolyl cis-trans isomerase A (cyclophilin A)
MVQKKPMAEIKLEAQNGLKNKRGAIAMARTSDPNSATSQFFINVVDNASLDYPKPDGHGYAVFGEVVAGMDVVDKIRAVKTTAKPPHQNVPVETVTIESIKRAE